MNGGSEKNRGGVFCVWPLYLSGRLSRLYCVSLSGVFESVFLMERIDLDGALLVAGQKRGRHQILPDGLNLSRCERLC